MIDWLRTEHGGDVIVVKENDDGSALIQFKVEGELSEVINLSMSVTVPNVYEDKVHEARLILDLESKVEIDAADFRIKLDVLRVLRSEEHTSELQSRGHLVCRLL